jgi:type I restriction enzyme, S subunit
MIGNVKTTWRKVKLGGLVDITSSKRIYLSEYVKRGVPFFRSKEIIEKHANQKNNTELYISEEKFEKIKRTFGVPAENDLLLTSVGTIGIPYLVKKNDHFYFKDGNLIWFRDLKNCDSKFIYYWLESQVGKAAVNSITIGSSQSAITIIGLKNLEILVPEDINEQKRITDILSGFDDKIELNNKINQNLEETARAIFKEWFIDNKKSRDWKVGKIADLFSIISGYPFSSKLYGVSKEALGVVTIKNVQDGNFVRDFDSFIKKENLPNKFNENCIIRDGDILLSLTGNVGRICFVYGGEYLLNQRVAKIRSKNGKDFAYCYFLFRQPAMQNYLINMAKGSAQPNLSPVETGAIQLDIPPRDLLDDFSVIVTPIYEQLIKNINENQKLASLRDLLLPKLMSGEIRI